MQSVIMMGRLVRDPEVKVLQQSGKTYARFSLAVSRGRKGKDGQYETDFFNCIAWDKTGEMIGNNFSKGQRMLARGEFRQQQWEKNGNKHTSYVYVVGNVNLIDYEKKEKPEKQEADAGAMGAFGYNQAEFEDLPF